ncbi:MAG: WYL domain-containing protein [Ruminococcus sp.]|nr:WYL domain-containing protein [Ruminococcus sp.]
MEKDRNRKLKLLKLLELLRQETDEQHPMKTTDICQRLESMDISCDRRILASEIHTLCDQGYEIQQCQMGRAKGYFIADRAFSMPELRMLLDAVEASQLLTEKKTQELKNKIVSLSSDKQAEFLKSSIVRFNSAKSTNERIYYTIEALEEAIRKKKKVTIRYFHLNEHREKVYRSENGIHTVEPIALVYNNDKYYLTCYNPVADKNYNYRLDRIEWVEILKEKISKNAIIRSRSVAKYNAQVFKMYGGETAKVTLAFDAWMIDYIYEKFGIDTKIQSCEDGSFTANVEVQLSPTFWGWLFQFTGQMRITAPEWACDEYTEMLKKAIGEQS